MRDARRFQQLAPEIAPGKNWAVMKFYLMRLYEQDIQRFGSANWCSTVFGERSHKDMKAQAAFTNGREEHMDLQVTCVLCVPACAALSRDSEHTWHDWFSSADAAAGAACAPCGGRSAADERGPGRTEVQRIPGEHAFAAQRAMS